jgi:hypothetical protein
MGDVMGFDLEQYLNDELPLLDAVDLSSVDSTDCPTVNEIWYWQLEERAEGLAISSRDRPYTSDYDHLFQYAHRHCLNSMGDVQKAPDDVLLESMRLPSVERWGWLHFIVRELGMTSLIINNWGYNSLKGFEDTRIGAPVEQRLAQAVLYFLDIMREKGFDPLAQVRELAKGFTHEGKTYTEEEYFNCLRGDARFEWICYVYDYHSAEIAPDERGSAKVLYSGDHRVKFATEVRAAAARRRAVWNIEYSCNCEEQARAAAEEKERAGIEFFLTRLYRGDRTEVSAVSDEKLMEMLCSLVRNAFDAREGKFGPPQASENLEAFLAINQRARELLRLPEHRELALIVRFRVLWLYVAPSVLESELPCYPSRSGNSRCEDCRHDPLHNLAEKYPPTAADAAMRVQPFNSF